LPKGLGLSKYGRKKIEQIDLIWLDAVGFPTYAFEVEKTTLITQAMERFIELLKIKITVSGKLILVCPSSRKTKMDEFLSQSAFVGSPMMMENKVKYLFFNDVAEIYNNCREKELSLETVAVEIRKCLHLPTVKEN
jgi:hypothetical protein